MHLDCFCRTCAACISHKYRLVNHLFRTFLLPTAVDYPLIRCVLDRVDTMGRCFPVHFTGCSLEPGREAHEVWCWEPGKVNYLVDSMPVQKCGCVFLQRAPSLVV